MGNRVVSQAIPKVDYKALVTGKAVSVSYTHLSALGKSGPKARSKDVVDG